MNSELYILWDPSLTIGPFRWYSLCWLIGLALAYYVVKVLYKEQHIRDELFDPLFLYCFVGILVGARLGHCLFYQPDYFLTSGKGFVEMLLPIHFLPDGGWKFTGYEGLASHGGTAGLMIALWVYCRNTRLSIWTVLDNIAIATGTTACFIRIGNLMNSEIIGKVTDVPWAFIFERVDSMPRHPGQLYEAIAYAVLFGLMWWLHKRLPQKIGTGWFFGLCLTYIFTFRFFIEYTKEIQEAFEASLPLDMGQILSLPFIAIGLACMAGGKWMKRLTTVALLVAAAQPAAAQGQDASEEKELVARYYELFSQPDKQQEFYAINEQVKDIMLSKGDRQRYFTYRINEITYEINMHRSSKALQKATTLLDEMAESEGDERYDMLYNVMGTLYEDRGNYRMAKHYMEKAIDNVPPKDTIGLIGSYLGMANLECSVHPEVTLEWVEKTLPLCHKYPSHYLYALTMRAMAYFFSNEQENFYQTLDDYNVYKRERSVNDEQDDKMMATIRAAFERDFDKALHMIAHDDFYTENIGRYDMRIQVYRLMGDKDRIIMEQQAKLNAIDSLNANLIYENINEMNAEMEVTKTKEKAARQRNYWLAVVVLLLAVVSGLLLWRYMTRRKLQSALQKQNKELEIALLHAEEADRMKSSFIQHVSHEIRTPLNVITGFAQVISNPDYKLGKEERDLIIADISRNTEEITNIVNELLEVAQDESRQHYNRKDTIAVNQLCRKMLDDAAHTNDKQLKLDFQTTLADSVTMRTDKEAFQKIMKQLLDNAMKFTKEGSVELFVHETPDHSMLRFTVTDTGIGIAKEHQEHVFDKFFKVDSFVPGFGLGLTMSLQMATLLDGSLQLDKEYTGGTRITLTLPAA